MKYPQPNSLQVQVTPRKLNNKLKGFYPKTLPPPDVVSDSDRQFRPAVDRVNIYQLHQSYCVIRR